MNITLHTTLDEFDALQDRWDDLVRQSFANTPFSLFAWQRAWWAAYQPGDLWIVTVKADGNLVGILPGFIETNDGRHTLRLIGHIDVVDYMDVIVRQGDETTVLSELADFLAEQRDHFDAIGLANIQEHSPTYEMFPDKLSAAGFETVDTEQNEVSPIIELPDNYDSYLNDILSSRERKETKRKMRKAEAGLYDVSWYKVGKDHDLDAELEQFLGLMASADAEKAAFLDNDQHVDFFKRVMPAMHEQGYLELLTVSIDGEPCAAYLNFDYNDKIYVYNSGLDPDKYGALSPGIVLIQFAIQHAIERGRKAFDLLRGDETYKYKMGATDTRIFQINAR
ncbi:MAG: GNAT family N-acetyltransferase [Chloroflexota bacterium]